MIIDVLKNFSFHSQWNAGILLFVLLSIVLYLFLFPTSKEHTKTKSTLFITGLLLIFVTVGSPLNLVGRIIFRGHIIQMLLLIFIIAPFILMGLKTVKVSNKVIREKLMKIMKWLTNPKLTLSVFHLLFFCYHIPVVFNFVRINYFLNYFYFFCLFISAFLMWFSIVPAMNELTLFSLKQRMKHCIINILLFLPVCFLLIFPNTILYSIYIDPDLLRSSLEVCLPPGETVETIPDEFFDYLLPYPPLKEQRIGGGILLISQVMIFGSMALHLKRRMKKE